eukprot:6877293-Pyramimonas_sp.AAC.1
MRIFSRQGGWRDHVHTCASSYLHAFSLGASQPKDMFEVPAAEHDVCGLNDVSAQECHVPSSSMVRASVEVAHRMSVLESEFQHRRTHSTLRQKRDGMHRYVFSGSEEHVSRLLHGAEASGAHVWSSADGGDRTMLQVFVPPAHVADLLRQIGPSLRP